MVKWGFGLFTMFVLLLGVGGVMGYFIGADVGYQGCLDQVYWLRGQ